jgi:O-antigen/teichoic acid export membrane protein
VLCSQAWVFRGTTRRLHIVAAETAPPAFSRQMLAYATPFSVWGIFTWMQASSDRWALQALTTSGQVGLFAIVSQLGAYPLNLVGAMLTQVAAPIVFARVGAGADMVRLRSALQLCGLLAAGMLAATLILAGGAALVHRQIFEFLVGPQFWTVSSLLPLAILSAGLFNVGQMASLVPMALGNSGALLAPKIGTALLALVLNTAGAYFFGIAGALAAGLIFAACYLGWVALVALRLFTTQTATPSMAAHSP